MSFIPIGDRQEEVLQKEICLILSIYHLFFFLFLFLYQKLGICVQSRMSGGVYGVCVVCDVSDPPRDFPRRRNNEMSSA